jgi:hypothetical protein
MEKKNYYRKIRCLVTYYGLIISTNDGGTDDDDDDDEWTGNWEPIAITGYQRKNISPSWRKREHILEATELLPLSNRKLKGTLNGKYIYDTHIYIYIYIACLQFVYITYYYKRKWKLYFD